MKNLLFVAIAAILFSACQKEGDIPEQNIEQANVLKSSLPGKGYQAFKYYSETPIDYDKTDTEVRSETDLWRYVPEWLKDDTMVFNNNDLTIIQARVKIPTNNSETFSRSYGVNADKDGVRFSFLTHEYNPLDYRLISFNDDILKVSATWNGYTVISEFKRVR